jgi:hypothetical protein
MSTIEIKDIEWMEETINKVPSNQLLYKFVCFCLGRRKKKISYKELYIFYTHVYGNDEVNKKKALSILLNIYKYNKEQEL